MTQEKISGAVQIGTSGASGSSVLERIDKDMAHRLNHLIHLGHDLDAAYEYALTRLEDEKLVAKLARLRESHAPFMEELSECVRSLGYKPTRHGDLHGLLERGRVVMGELVGDDGILHAMATNEQELTAAFRETLAMPGIPPAAIETIERALQKEELHRAFYDDALQRFVG